MPRLSLLSSLPPLLLLLLLPLLPSPAGGAAAAAGAGGAADAPVERDEDGQVKWPPTGGAGVAHAGTPRLQLDSTGRALPVTSGGWSSGQGRGPGIPIGNRVDPPPLHTKSNRGYLA
jgi:hypothetical protein